ncbi:MAG TPA: nucleotide exchange factor GrpE [Candidatus Paceibacterota bacterium]
MNNDKDENEISDTAAPLGDIVETDEEGGEVGKLATLKEKLNACLTEKGEYLDGWQRSKADYANFKREVAEREKDLEARLSQRIVRDLLPVLESIDLARMHVKDLEPIERQLEKVMTSYGLEKVGAVGEAFEPSKHEAVENIVVAEAEKDNIILELVSSGYSLGGRVLKPAKVKVGALNI